MNNKEKTGISSNTVYVTIHQDQFNSFKTIVDVLSNLKGSHLSKNFNDWIKFLCFVDNLEEQFNDISCIREGFDSESDTNPICMKYSMANASPIKMKQIESHERNTLDLMKPNIR